MNRSKLINHINHLEEELKVLDSRREIRLKMKKLDAILIYDTAIKLLENRVKECKAQLEEDKHVED